MTKPTITKDAYYWLASGESAYVLDIRSNGWVEVLVGEGEYRMVAHHELRQCKCECTGRYHWHRACDKIRLYRCERPNY